MLLRKLTALLLLVGAVVVGQEAHGPHPLSALEHRTGWISMGLRDLRTNRWVTVRKQRIDSPVRSRQAIPEAGDVLVVTMPQPIIIVGFKDTGERDYLVSPANLTGSLDNHTGVTLSPGTRVVVLDVQRAEPYTGLYGVWARVGVPKD